MIKMNTLNTHQCDNIELNVWGVGHFHAHSLSVKIGNFCWFLIRNEAPEGDRVQHLGDRFEDA